MRLLLLRFLLLAGLFFIGSLTLVALHEYYVSICQITHNTEEKSLQITLKIFADDLEEALKDVSTNNINKIDLEATDSTEMAFVDTLIAQYIKKHLAIQVNDLVLSSNDYFFWGKELESDSDLLLCYLEVYGIPEHINTLEVQNTLLIDLFRTQSNIVHIKANGGSSKKSLLLSKSKIVDSVNF